MKNLNAVDWIAVVLTIIGGINWGLVGIGGWDLVALVGGGAEGTVARIIYVIVGLAALWLIFTVSKSAGGSGDASPAGAERPQESPGMGGPQQM